MQLGFCPARESGEVTCKLKMDSVAGERTRGTFSRQAGEPKMMQSNWKKESLK